MNQCFIRCLLFAIMACSLACAAPRLSSIPTQGGSPWRQLDSENFTLQTDLPADEAREGVVYLEQTRAALLAAGWPGLGPREMRKISVYAFSRGTDFDILFPRREDSLFSTAGNEPVLILRGSPDSWLRHFEEHPESSHPNFRYDLAHYLGSYMLLRQPRWFSEGLAQILEAMELSEDSTRAVLRMPRLLKVTELVQMMKYEQLGDKHDWSIQDVFAWDSPGDIYRHGELANMYWGSWILVYWVYNTRPWQFSDLQRLLAAGEAPGRAWKKALIPDTSTTSLERSLTDYLSRGAYTDIKVQVPAVAPRIIERPLRGAEVHALRSRLAMLSADLSGERSQERLDLARLEAEAALRLEPANLIAMPVKMAVTPVDHRLPLADVAVVAHPKEGRAWLLLAETLREVDAPAAEQEEAYKKALALSPLEVSAMDGLAWLYITQKRYEEALTLAMRAVELAPWSASVLDTYATVLAELGRCSDAIQAEQRALEVLQGGADKKLRESLRNRLASFNCARSAGD